MFISMISLGLRFYLTTYDLTLVYEINAIMPFHSSSNDISTNQIKCKHV